MSPPTPNRPGRVDPRAEVARSLRSLAVLAACTAVVTARPPSRLERRTFDEVNRLPGGLETALWLPMQLGSLWGPVAVGAVLRRRTGRWRPAATVVAAGTATWQLAKVVKAGVGRGRPAAELGPVATRRGTPSEGMGFVSGHSAVASCLAGVLGAGLDPRGRLVVGSLAATVGLARIHVAAHLPLDVVGGAALGLAVAHAVNAVVPVDLRREP